MQLKHNWDFFGHRKVFYAIPLVIFAIILIFALIFGVKVDIQFTGGTIATYSYSGTIDRSAIASAAKEETGLSATVDTSQSLSSDSQQFSISFGNKQSLSMETQQALTDRLISDFPDNNIEQVSIDSVSATMGKDFLVKCLIAVLASFVLMILYITIRFRRIGGLSAGITGVIALFHDVLMVLGTFIIFRLPIDDNFMAVILFILGYSINDTIVIFDRIRENEKLYGKSLDFPQLLNKSVNQTFTRTLNTSISTLIAMISVCVFALIFRVSNILTFAFPMVVGLVAGSYSSLCLTGTIWAIWKNRKPAAKKK